MSHCQDQSCCSGCGCDSKSSCCSEETEHGCHESECDFASTFLELADEAWMEVLKEKIMDHIRANAKNMDQLAALISETNNSRWHKKMEHKQCKANYEEKLREFLHMSCGGQSCQSEGQKK